MTRPRATLPFLTALGAVEAGHKAEISLIGEAVYLMKDSVADQIDGVGWPPFKDLLPQVIEHEIPIYIWGGCAKVRGVSESDLAGKNAKFITFKDFVELMLKADRVVNF